MTSLHKTTAKSTNSQNPKTYQNPTQNITKNTTQKITQNTAKNPTPSQNPKSTQNIKTKNYAKDSLSTRIIIILQSLYSGASLKADTLASEFGTSLRTIQRDLSHIASILPLKSHNGIYQLDMVANYGGGGGKSQVYQAICLYQRDRSTISHAR